MSSNRWKKLHERKVYRERGQTDERAHLGLLEKKKDYKVRARDAHRKKEVIDSLERKAAFRNPDEFYHKMIKAKKVDGKFERLPSAEDEPTLAEKLDLRAGDISYLAMRKKMEQRKVEDMKGRLMMARELTPDELRSKHTVFVDTPEQAEEFDEREYFDTDHVLRAYNRPTREAAEKGIIVGAVGADVNHSRKLARDGVSTKDIGHVERQRSLAYGELSARVDRKAKLTQALDRMELRQHLQKDPNVIRQKRNGKVTYKWRTPRKR